MFKVQISYSFTDLEADEIFEAILELIDETNPTEFYYAAHYLEEVILFFEFDEIPISKLVLLKLKLSDYNVKIVS